MKKFLLILQLVLLFLLSDCLSIGNSDKNLNLDTFFNRNTIKVPLLLYFPGPDSKYLVSEERYAEIGGSLEKTIVSELINGPDIGESPIPGGTKLISVSRKGDTVTVNLSGAFTKNNSGIRDADRMCVFSIVNSLTEIPGIKWVNFKIEGKSMNAIKGFKQPLARNRELLTRNKDLDPGTVLKTQMEFESSGRWLEAYALMSDNPEDTNRKYYSDYVKEMEEVRGLGFTDQKFKVGSYELNDAGDRASVRVDFYENYSDGSTAYTAHFNCVKIDGAWMADWLTTQ